MRPPNNHANGAIHTTYKRYGTALVMATLLCGVGFLAYTSLPRVGCAPPSLIHAARNATGGGLAAAVQQHLRPHASGGSAGAAGLGLFGPLLPQLLPLTNFSVLPSAAVIDAALQQGLTTAHVRSLMQLQQQYYCEAGFHKQPWPGIVGVPFHNVTVFVYGSNDIVSSSLKGAGHGWEAAEMQEWLWALRAWRPAPPPSLPQQAAGALAAAVSSGSTTPVPPQTKPLAVDIGANLGWFALNAAAAGAQVAAFEAMSSNMALIRRSLCANPWLADKIALYGVGLAEKTSSCYIISGDGNQGDGFTICDRHKAHNTKGYQVRGIISLRQLDTMLHEDIQVMKIDVEGFEQKVLEGARQLLAARRVRYIMAECNTGIIGDEAGRAFIRFLDAQGYEVSPQTFRGPFWSQDQVTNASCSNINLYARLKGLEV